MSESFDYAVRTYLHVLAGDCALRIVPFVLLLNATDASPYQEYAVPDDAEPTPANVNALIAAFADRERKPMLEYLATVCPRVQSAVLGTGFSIKARLRVMTCASEDATVPPVGSSFALMLASIDDQLRLIAQAQYEAYGAPEATEHDVVRLRGTRDRGGLVALDLGTATEIGIGGALCAPPHRGVSELAAVGEGVAYRRRGITAALTGLLTRACPTVGITRLFLMPAGRAQQRIYQRVGYRRVTESLPVERGCVSEHVAGGHHAMTTPPVGGDRDSEAWIRTLYHAHGRAVLAYISQMTGDRYEAQDVLQETMLRAWRHQQELVAGPGSVRGWLLTVAKHVALDRARARLRRPQEVAEVPSHAAAEPDRANQVVDSIVVYEAMQKLSEEQREVLILLRFQGRSVREAAEVLGVPEGTVKSRAYHALLALRKWLGDSL